MRGRNIVLSTVCMCGFALVLASEGAAAPADCLAAPNRTVEEGQHWYFRTERATNRKCWFLLGGEVGTTGAVDRQQARQPQAAAQSSAGPPAQAYSAEGSGLSEASQEALFHEFLRWYKERGAAQ